MASQKISYAALTKGVSTLAPHEREFGTVSEANNTMMRSSRGLEKRAGTELIAEISSANPTNNKYVHWIDRDDDEKFCLLIDPAAAQGSRIEPVTLVSYTDTQSSPVTYAPGAILPYNIEAGIADDDYFTTGTLSAHLRFSGGTVADSTVLLNRTVETNLVNDANAIQYSNSSGNIRIKSNPSNLDAWSDFPQPPSVVTTVANDVPASISNGAVYYAQDDDLGWPSGWYAAVSSTTAPWYERIRAETNGSLIDKNTMPVQVTFDGESFTLDHADWGARYSGDSFTNPGPNILARPYGKAIKARDIAFYQSRLFLGGDEFVDSSQAGDLFNLWQESQAILVDSDPIRVQTQSDAITLVDWLLPTDSGLLILTNGSRQFILTSNGALTPTASVLVPIGSYNTSPEIRPVRMGSSVYFGTIRNDALVLYHMKAEGQQTQTMEITQGVEGFIKGPIRDIKVSEQNEMMFITSESEHNAVYVVQRTADQHAFMKWSFNCDKVVSVQAYNSDLYMVLRRNNKLWLEKVNIDVPVFDDDGIDYISSNMGFGVRLDQKVSLAGTYDPNTQLTTWVIDHADASVDTVVLGQGFDVDYNGGANKQRWRGRVIGSDILQISTVGNTTEVKAPGDYSQNLNSQTAKVWLGKQFDMNVTLSEPFIQTANDNQPAVYSIVHMRTGMIRLTDSAALTVKVTPFDRDPISKDFFTVQTGMYTLGEPLILADEEFHFNVLGQGHNTKVELINTTPYPSRLNSLELICTVNSYKRDPSRGAFR